MRYTLLGLLLIVPFLSGCGPSSLQSEIPSLYQEIGGSVTDFELTNQIGDSVSSGSLRGKVYVVSFFYTSCPVCHQDNHIKNLQSLAKQLTNIDGVVLLSITLNPEKDDPDVLAKFGEDMDADPKNWMFLTGSQDTIDQITQRVFYQPLERNPKAEDPKEKIIHSFRMLLVNHKGHIVGYANGLDENEVNQVRERVVELVQAQRLESGYYFPTLNAGLNALSGLFLLIGYLAIRNRKITLHKACMLTAIVVSAIFLGCYLYYHFGIRTGEPTRYLGLGWMKTVYFTVLLSHTILAMVVAPLALVTAYLGLRNKLSRHVTIARWTFPLWIYVSVTGVVVYVMLYHR